jgi:peptidoglycan/xylan/chitin deacetylase (PgdA/CDA1 family)
MFRDRRPGLVILCYHRVGGGTESEIDLGHAVFERQMAYLHTHCHVISLNDLADDSAAVQAGVGDVVAVTFDDGHRETYDVAFPVLQRHRVPATVYVPTDYVERQRPFDFGAHRRNEQRAWPLTWLQIREMVDSGLVAIGGHTHTHADLTRLEPSAARAELERNRRTIEDRLGVAPRHFAYPWGALTPALKPVVGEYFVTAARGGSGKNPYGRVDPLALWRRPVQQSDGFWFFRFKLHSYLDGEEYLRGLAARHWFPASAAGPA